MKEDSHTQDHKKENKKSAKSKGSRFLEKLDFAQISELEDLKKAPEDHSTKNEEKHESSSFLFLNDILGPERVNKIRNKKMDILMGIGIIIGILFVAYGINILMAPVEKVADNVIFGEKEVFSVFLILIGVIVIASSLAPKIMGNSFFKEIDNDQDTYDNKSSNSTKDNIKKDNINRDNR